MNIIILQVPQAKQKPNDTFMPSPVASPTDSVIQDLSINETTQNESSSDATEETLPELLAPATQEEESFFLTSTQVEPALVNEISEISESENETLTKTPETPKRVPKTVETRRNKREHPPNSPSVASPARKIEKRNLAVPESSSMANTSQGRLTRSASKGVAKTQLSSKKSKPATPLKPTKSVKATESIESLPKRVPKPSEKAKAVVENVPRRNAVRTTKSEGPAITVESPQRLSRTVNSSPKTPKTPISNARKAASAKKLTLAPEIVPETPPSSSRTRSAKKVVESPDVIPGSPMGLIGLRSLTKKNLRSRNPVKKT